MTSQNWQGQICRKILDGLRAACDDTVLFTEDFSRPIDAEYLASVYVAKKISTLNSGLGFPLKIFLEKSAGEFKATCAPMVKSIPAANFTGRELVFRDQPSIDRPGRIDVAVMRDGPVDTIPICAIELKAFNFSRENVVADLQRNTEYFKGGLTGASRVEFTVLAVIRSYNATASREAKARKTFEGYAAAVPPPHNVVASVLVETLRAGTIDEDGHTPQFIAGLIIFSSNCATSETGVSS